MQRNFQGYSTHGECDLIGLGVSAISSIGNAYSQNSISTKEYEELLSDDSLAVMRGIDIDQDDTLRGKVIQDLMCYDCLKFSDFEKAHGVEFSSYFQRELEGLEPLARDGLVQLDDQQILITAKGRLLLRSIAMVFDRYLNSDDKIDRFSKAI